MNLTPEQIEKAKSAKSAEELLQMAKNAGYEITGEAAANYYTKLHGSEQIADEELDNVTGGGTCGVPTCPFCGSTIIAETYLVDTKQLRYSCNACNTTWYD